MQDSFGQITAQSITVSIILSLITILIGNFVYFLLRRFLDERIDKNFSKIFSRLANYFIYFIGFYLIFTQILGINLSSVLTAAGIATIIIGLSAQQTFQNIIAGIIIAIERPIKLGDWVEVGGFPLLGLSKVKDMTLFRIVFRRLDGSICYVPNSVLMTSNIINYSKAGFLKIAFTLTISSDNDLAKVEKIILDACRSHPLVLPNIPERKNLLNEIIEKEKIPRIEYLAEKFSKLVKSGVDLSEFMPRVLVKSFDGSKMILEVWVRTADVSKKDEIVSDLMKGVLKQFKKKKIKL
jgi:small-conductance mechanosensitive channel